MFLHASSADLFSSERLLQVPKNLRFAQYNDSCNRGIKVKAIMDSYNSSLLYGISIILKILLVSLSPTCEVLSPWHSKGFVG